MRHLDLGLNSDGTRPLGTTQTTPTITSVEGYSVVATFTTLPTVPGYTNTTKPHPTPRNKGPMLGADTSHWKGARSETGAKDLYFKTTRLWSPSCKRKQKRDQARAYRPDLTSVRRTKYLHRATKRKGAERITVDLQYSVESERKFRVLKRLTCRTWTLMKTNNWRISVSDRSGLSVADVHRGLEKGAPRVESLQVWTPELSVGRKRAERVSSSSEDSSDKRGRRIWTLEIHEQHFVKIERRYVPSHGARDPDDIAGPFPVAAGGLKFLIVAIDYFTKWIRGGKRVATSQGIRDQETFVYRAKDASFTRKIQESWGPKWEGPYEVTEALGKGAYKLRDMDGRELPRTWNICNLKKCYL
ncbi:hypothetical protein Tco_1456693 [Tanacetum coccineum]